MSDSPTSTSTPTPPSSESLQVAKVPKDILICVFIHGFKGTDDTFGGFPQRLQHIMEQSVTAIKTECIVFPAYETKGDLNQAVHRFVDWLTTLTVQKEVAQGLGGGAGKAKIVLCSHSMGGLLAADAILAIVNSRPDNDAPVWPNIIACIAFDTPYLGLHPWVFKNSASKAVEYASIAKTIASGLGLLGGTGGKSLDLPSTQPSPSPSKPIAALPVPENATGDGDRAWTRFLNPTVGYAAGGLLLASAAAGTAYYRRDDIGMTMKWAQDHMKYVGNLWEESKLQERLLAMIKLGNSEQNGGHEIIFRNFYSYLPPAKGLSQARTFIILPPPNKGSKANPADYFLAARNNIAEDEVSAHMGMFAPSTNDGYYELGLGVVEVIRNALGELPFSEADADSIVESVVVQEEEEKSGEDIRKAGEDVSVDDKDMEKMRNQDERTDRIHEAVDT